MKLCSKLIELPKMFKQINLLQKLRQREQTRIEILINTSNHKIAQLNTELNELEQQLSCNQFNKSEYIKSFYLKLNSARNFTSNTLLELEIETSIFNVQYKEILEEIKLKINEIEVATMENNQLHQDLKGKIIKNEKYLSIIGEFLK